MSKYFALCVECSHDKDIDEIKVREVQDKGTYWCGSCGGKMQVKELKDTPSYKFKLKSDNGNQ